MLVRLTKLAPIVAAFMLVPITAQADAAPAAGSQTLRFIVNISPQNVKSVPWTGDMTLKINPEGIINGTYRSTSVRPDPFYGKIVTVTGGLTGGNNIRLDFGAKGYFPVKGEFHPGAGIVGTARMKSTMYDFVAKQESK